MVANCYIHFPFCRGKCSYCSLYSRVGVSSSDRDDYVRKIAREFSSLIPHPSSLRTLYFGGGSPALCDLSPFSFLIPHPFEFTIEVHPHDVTEEKLSQLKALGVNRLSMGLQSFDNATLEKMGRGYTLEEAEQAFIRAKAHIDNVGLDLIVGYPGDEMKGTHWREGLRRFVEKGLRHCSVYSLQNERGLKDVPDDNLLLDRLREVGAWLQELGLARYEISNYAQPGFECRHNLAVWCGEDYLGIGEGACGRVGLTRSVGRPSGYSSSTVTHEEDQKERTLFRLRTHEGLEASHFPAWIPILDKYVQEELLTKEGQTYYLTNRGTEVCDSILAELV